MDTIKSLLMAAWNHLNDTIVVVALLLLCSVAIIFEDDSNLMAKCALAVLMLIMIRVQDISILLERKLVDNSITNQLIGNAIWELRELNKSSRSDARVEDGDEVR